MATELETPVDSSQQCLERGTQLLAMLQRAAVAARLDAQVAELESVVAEARRGVVHRLERWLKDFDEAQNCDLPNAIAAPQAASLSPASETASCETVMTEPATTEPVTTEPVTTEPVTTEPVTTEPVTTEPVGLSGWASYLPHVQRRLCQRPSLTVSELRHMLLDLETTFTAKPHKAEHFHAISYASSDAVPDEVPNAVPNAIDDATDDSVGHVVEDALKVAIDDGIEDATEEAIPIHALCGVFDSAPLGIEHDRPSANGRRMMSGMSLSLVGHTALLFALCMITYKLPRESASLGSQIESVTAVAENVELSQPFDVPAPLELELPEVASPNMSEAQPTALAEISTSSLAEVMSGTARSQASGPASSMAAAMLAGGSKQGRGSAAAGGGGAAALSKVGGKFFGVGAGGNFFCYVVDSSGSMRGGAWESAKEELFRSLATLSERQRFYIIFFAKEFVAIPEPEQRVPATYGLFATPRNIDHARRWIETIKLDRGGPPNDALAWAIDRDPDAIYLLTDGVTKTDVCTFLREKNRIDDFINGQQVRVPIHAIAYQSLDGQSLLRQLAQENKGQFHYVPPPNTTTKR
jgi:hypothetical protein